MVRASTLVSVWTGALGTSSLNRSRRPLAVGVALKRSQEDATSSASTTRLATLLRAAAGMPSWNEPERGDHLTLELSFIVKVSLSGDISQDSARSPSTCSDGSSK